LCHVLGCDGTKEWRQAIFEKRIWNLNPITDIQRLVRGRNIENFKKIRVYISKYK
jgi:hypothetical protein